MKRLYAICKWAVSGGVVVIVFNHLLMTAIYLSPANLLKKGLGRAAYSYMLPLFFQNWHLFSPYPTINSTKLAVRCRKAGQGWSSWRDPLDDLYAKHYHYRISGHGKLIYVYGEIAIALDREFNRKRAECLEDASQRSGIEPAQCSFERIAVQIEETPSYALARRYAQRACEDWSPGQSPEFKSTAHVDQIQFKILSFYPLEYPEQDQTGKRSSAVEEVAFKPVEPAPPR